MHGHMKVKKYIRVSPILAYFLQRELLMHISINNQPMNSFFFFKLLRVSIFALPRERGFKCLRE